MVTPCGNVGEDSGAASCDTELILALKLPFTPAIIEIVAVDTGKSDGLVLARLNKDKLVIVAVGIPLTVP